MFETVAPLAIFALASSVTPGPNNIMLLASGANFGLRRTLPHMLGISAGHGIQILVTGLVLLTVFDRFPWVKVTLLAVCAVYLLYLAWRIANAAPPGEAAATGKPLTSVEAAAFQWVNPKAWYMAIYAQSSFAPAEAPLLAGAALVASVFIVMNFMAITLWAWGGVQMRRFLSSPKRLRAFNVTMALCLVATLYPAARSVLGS